jgi:hypothetical protein
MTIDEINLLQDIALVPILRQLRDGYSNRPNAFSQSVGLIGMQDVRDYKHGYSRKLLWIAKARQGSSSGFHLRKAVSPL